MSESQNLANAANNQNHNVNHRTVVKMQGIYQLMSVWLWNLVTVHLRRWQIFTIFDPFPLKKCRRLKWIWPVDGPLAKTQF